MRPSPAGVDWLMDDLTAGARPISRFGARGRMRRRHLGIRRGGYRPAFREQDFRVAQRQVEHVAHPDTAQIHVVYDFREPLGNPDFHSGLGA